jgi:hypothetical protein
VLMGPDEKPDPAVANLSDAVTAGGENRVLLFLRPAARKGGLEVLYVIYLNREPLPAGAAERAAAYRAAIPEGYPRPKPTDSTRCVAIDRTGKVLVDPDEVVARVEKRARQHPKRFTEAGFIAPRGEELEDQNSVYFVFAPYDPEERAVFLKQLQSASGTDRAGAAHHLAHYPDAEVIAALKKCLTDDYFNDQHIEEPGARPRPAKIYVVRRAAYESLRQLKVEVPRPELEHRR